MTKYLKKKRWKTNPETYSPVLTVHMKQKVAQILKKKQPNTDNVWLCFLYLLCCVCCHVGEYVFFCVFFSRTALRATVIFASNEWFNCLLLSWRCTKHINGWLDTVYFSLYGPITMVTLGNPSRSFDVLYSQSQKVSFWLSDRVFFFVCFFAQNSSDSSNYSVSHKSDMDHFIVATELYAIKSLMKSHCVQNIESSTQTKT